MTLARATLLDIPFSTMTFQETVTWLVQRLEQQQGTFVVTANPEIVMTTKRSLVFKNLVLQADIITPDGIGIVMAAKKKNLPIRERVTGYDLFLALLTQANQAHWRVFLVGAQPEVLAAAKQRLARDYPQIELVGAVDGYFKNAAQVQAQIKAAQPQLVFAALGSPKQEQFLMTLRADLPATLLMGVGGSFDVFSGKAKRAPHWMQASHLEWFYRLIKQPSRWRRMLDLPRFLQAVKHEDD